MVEVAVVILEDIILTIVNNIMRVIVEKIKSKNIKQILINDNNVEILISDGIPRYESNGIIASLIDITKKQDDRGSDNTQKKIDTFENKHKMGYQEALDKIRYTCWDVISVDEYYNNKSDVVYLNRFDNLTYLISDLKLVSLIEGKIVKTYEEAIEHFQELLNKYDGEIEMPEEIIETIKNFKYERL